MADFWRLIEVGTDEVNSFLSYVGMNFVFTPELLSSTFIIVILCIALLVTLIGDRRSRSIIMVFVFLAMFVSVVLFLLRSWLVMTGRV